MLAFASTVLVTAVELFWTTDVVLVAEALIALFESEPLPVTVNVVLANAIGAIAFSKTAPVAKAVAIFV